MSFNCPTLNVIPLGNIECDIEDEDHDEHHAVFGNTHVFWNAYQVS